MDEKAINRAFQLLNEEIQSIKEGLTQSWKSEKIDKLVSALVKAKKGFGIITKRGRVHLNQTKTVGYDYALYQDAIDATEKALLDNGLVFSNLAQIDGSCKGVLMHESGQWIAGDVLIKPVKGDPQAFGSAFTYMAKYGYMKTLNLPTDDDDGVEAEGNGKPKDNSYLKESEIAEYHEKVKGTYGIDLVKKGMQKILKRTRWGKLTKDEIANLDKWLKSELNKDLDKKAEQEQGELL